jgi:hypothetical protein
MLEAGQECYVGDLDSEENLFWHEIYSDTRVSFEELKQGPLIFFPKKNLMLM